MSRRRTREIWKQRLGLPARSRTCEDIAPSPSRDQQLPSLQRKARLSDSSAFPSYLQCTPSLGEARLQHIRQCCIATLVMFGFGKKKKNKFPAHCMSPGLAAAMTLHAGLAWLYQVGTSRDLMQQRGPKRRQQPSTYADFPACFKGILFARLKKI